MKISWRHCRPVAPFHLCCVRCRRLRVRQWAPIGTEALPTTTCIWTMPVPTAELVKNLALPWWTRTLRRTWFCTRTFSAPWFRAGWTRGCTGGIVLLRFWTPRCCWFRNPIGSRLCPTASCPIAPTSHTTATTWRVESKRGAAPSLPANSWRTNFNRGWSRVAALATSRCNGFDVRGEQNKTVCYCSISTWLAVVCVLAEISLQVVASCFVWQKAKPYLLTLQSYVSACSCIWIWDGCRIHFRPVVSRSAPKSSWRPFGH